MRNAIFIILWYCILHLDLCYTRENVFEISYRQWAEEKKKNCKISEVYILDFQVSRQTM